VEVWRFPCGKQFSGCSNREEPGEVAEWLMAPVLKTGVPERVPGVRIPPSPPLYRCLWSGKDAQESAASGQRQDANSNTLSNACPSCRRIETRTLGCSPGATFLDETAFQDRVELLH
jgi:hypothetical protein